MAVGHVVSVAGALAFVEELHDVIVARVCGGVGHTHSVHVDYSAHLDGPGRDDGAILLHEILGRVDIEAPAAVELGEGHG